MGRLDLEPGTAARSGRVRGIQHLRHHAFVPDPHRALQELCRRVRILGHDPVQGHVSRQGGAQGREPLPRRLVDQPRSVQVEAVEEERLEWGLLAQTLHIEAAPEAAHRGLEGKRGSVRAQGDRLAVQDDLARREIPHRLDDLRQRSRDVVQAPGEDPDVVAGLVQLDPRSVQLRLERGSLQVAQGLVHVLGGLGQHRLNRAKQADSQRSQRLCSAGEGRSRHLAGVVGQHHGPAHPRLGDGSGGRHRIEHHAGLRPLPQLAEDEPPEERLLGLRSAGQ